MGRPNDIAFQIALEDLGFPTLHSPGHGLANEWKGLMAIEAAKLYDFSVQLEAVVGELRLAEADTTGIGI